IKKETGSLRFIPDMQPLNAVTLRDCGQVPHCEKFSEPFSGRSIYSLMDLFSFYD
ncbi:hypothetical protein ROZALSC1DRAFT_7296, partial [Rozella allomycis CSF55]